MGNCICNLDKDSINVQKINVDKFGSGSGSSSGSDLNLSDEQTQSLTSTYIAIKKPLNFSTVKKMFISYNVLNYEKNIIIGIWNNPNKSNTLGNQGIWIGGHDKIYELTFGMLCANMVVLNFQNSIKLKIYKNKSNNITFELTENKKDYIKQLDDDIKKNLKKINNDSEDIDLIFNLVDN
jgi:hypothetical protein